MTLYGVHNSHPVQAVRGMLEHKGLPYEAVELRAGPHAMQLRLKGFPGTTVPALDIDGEKVQGSTRISRRLEALQPDPPLFGADPAERLAIEEAEEWGERELQGIHRRALRHALVRRNDLRAGLKLPLGVTLPKPLAGAAAFPQAVGLAVLKRASGPRVRSELATLPDKLDHVDALIAAGTIGGAAPNAADFQIGATMWSLLAFEDFRPLVAGRPAARLAGLVAARRAPVPSFVPPGWLPA